MNVIATQVQYLNPEKLHANPGYTQMVTVVGPVRSIYIGAQCAVNQEGEIVGKGDVGAQTEQVLRNLQTCLDAVGAGPENLIEWTIYLVEGQPMQPAFAAGMRWWGAKPNPPINNVLYVSALANPDFLISIEAVAVLPA